VRKLQVNDVIKLFRLFVLTLVVFSCQSDKTKAVAYECPMHCEGATAYTSPGICPVCKMDLVRTDETQLATESRDISDVSIFNLSSKWITQNGDTIELKDLNGNVLVMVMIYTSCTSACPRLVYDVRDIHQKLADPSVKYIFVSIDPETDTPQRLKNFAQENQMDGPQWVFLQGSLEDVRVFANVLAVKYKKIDPQNFSHSSIISVFDKNGILSYQREGLGEDTNQTVREIQRLTALD
jgi:protein SCO1/2